jgi:hypothetical protein
MQLTVVNSFDDVPSPQLLKQSVWVHVTLPREQKRILCARCELKELRVVGDLFYDTPQTCLNICGAIIENKNKVPNQLDVTFIIVPIQFVTYIGLGPAITTVPVGEPNRVVISPEGAPPENRMSTDSIQATLREFYDPQ